MHSKRVTRRAPPPDVALLPRSPYAANCTRLYPCRFRRIPLSRGKYLMFGKNRTTPPGRPISLSALTLSPGAGFPASCLPSRPLSLSLSTRLFCRRALRSAPVSVFGTFLLCTCGGLSLKNVCFFFLRPRRPSTTASRPPRARTHANDRRK